jgi:predicted deacylase
VNGTSSSSAAELGIPAITAEAGGCGLVEAPAVALHVAGLNGVLARLGMTEAPAAAPPAEPVYLGRFLWPRCREAGWWAPTIKAGDTVRQGQVVGTVTSLDGATVKETIAAPADGVVIFVTCRRRVATSTRLPGVPGQPGGRDVTDTAIDATAEPARRCRFRPRCPSPPTVAVSRTLASRRPAPGTGARPC